jgi:hypothetical protein
VVWSCIYYVYLTRLEGISDNAYLWCYGFLLSGLVLVFLGLFVGRIGRAARHAEVAAPGAQTPAPANTATNNRATTVAPGVVVRNP